MGKRPLTYGDLTHTHADRVFLYCERCGNRWSATRGDYFTMSDTDRIVCTNGGQHRQTPMLLMREECRLIEVPA